MFDDIKEVNAPLHYGPLQLNPSSRRLSEIVNNILLGKEAKFSYSDEQGLEVEIEGKTHNISMLLETANFSHLQIDHEAMESYPQTLKKSGNFYYGI